MTPVVLSPFAHWLLTTAIFLLVPLSVVAPHGIVWEIIIGGLAGLYYSRKHLLANLSSPLTTTLFLIPLWALVTALWSQYPVASCIAALRILALVTLGLYWCRFTLSLPQETKKSFMNALVGGLFLSLFFLMIDVWFGNLWQAFWKKSAAKAFAQGSLLISLATWPTLLWILQRPHPLWLRVSLGVGSLLLIFWTLLQIDCDTSFISLFLGLCVFFKTLLFPRATSWGMRLFIPFFIISFPFISLYAFKPSYIPVYNSFIYSPSYLDRLYIWNDVATSILEHPWQGIGMDGTRYHKKAQEIRNWSYFDKNGVQQKNQTAHFATHPHNAILQLWLELGVLGLVLGMLLACQALSCIYTLNLYPIEKATGAGLFMGTFFIVWVNLGFWQNWWIAGLWIIIGLTIMMFKGTKERQ